MTSHLDAYSKVDYTELLKDPATSYSLALCIKLRNTELFCLNLFQKCSKDILEILDIPTAKEAKKKMYSDVF